MAETTTYTERRAQVMTASGLDVLAGIWLLISPFVITFRGLPNAVTNDVVFGIVVAVLAAIRFFGAYRASWISWLNALIGLWILVSPWFLGFSIAPEAMWNNVLTGIAIIILGGWSALASGATAGETRTGV
ncbi:MAG: SPW repeat protein [Thermoanaerobaculia bacterium]